MFDATCSSCKKQLSTEGLKGENDKLVENRQPPPTPPALFRCSGCGQQSSHESDMKSPQSGLCRVDSFAWFGRCGKPLGIVLVDKPGQMLDDEIGPDEDEGADAPLPQTIGAAFESASAVSRSLSKILEEAEHGEVEEERRTADSTLQASSPSVVEQENNALLENNSLLDAQEHGGVELTSNQQVSTEANNEALPCEPPSLESARGTPPAQRIQHLKRLSPQDAMMAWIQDMEHDVDQAQRIGHQSPSSSSSRPRERFVVQTTKALTETERLEADLQDLDWEVHTQLRDRGSTPMSASEAMKKAADTEYPLWCALVKVCYRVGDDLIDAIKVTEAVDKFQIVAAEYGWTLEGGIKMEYLKDPETGFLLPLRHPKTGEAIFLLMEPREGGREVTAPDQVHMGCYPPEECPMIPESAPPGGKWREASYCGPATICLCACGCCLCVLCLGKGKPIDLKPLYDAPDGNTYSRYGKCQKNAMRHG